MKALSSGNLDESKAGAVNYGLQSKGAKAQG
jgi:hypothetical protein